MKHAVFTTPSNAKILIRNAILLMIAIGIVFATWQMRQTVSAVRKTDRNSYVDLINSSRDVDKVITQYNDDMNRMFNEKIKKMVDAMDKATKKGDIDPKKISGLFAPPPYIMKEGIPTVRQDCASLADNLSTYCLAIAGTQKYFDFRDAMIKARNIVQNDAASKLSTLNAKSSGRDIAAADRNIRSIGQTYEMIDREIEIAKQTLDQALATYQEMQTALPLHTKYMQIVKSLEKYRNNVSALRKKVEEFPATFLDVTTTQCT